MTETVGTLHSVTLSIGSNSLDKDFQMQDAIDWLNSILKDSHSSSVYSTPSINGKGDDYLNAVIIGRTSENLEKLNSICKEYEKSRGRTPESKLNASIPIDIDIVVYDDKIIREKDFSFDYFKIGYIELTANR